MSIRCYLIIVVALLCNGCQIAQKTEIEQTQTNDAIYDLVESTDIITQLIKTDELQAILIDSDAENIKKLLRNFSPSEMAFESEILNYKGMAAVIFYHQGKEWDAMRIALLSEAKKLPDIKWVQVDAQELFKVTENGNIEQFPAIVFIKDRKEVGRIEPINIKEINKITDIINDISCIVAR